MTSHLIVERPATLDLLQRDANQLQRALNDAGLRSSDNGLQFSLRDHSFGQQQPRDNAPTQTTRVFIPDSELVAAELPRNYLRQSGQGSGLDIRV